MKTKNQSYTLDEEVIYKLGVFAKGENISKSSAVNKILGRFLSVEVKVSLADTPYEKKLVAPVIVVTEKERLADWEWRKGMVAQGKFPVHMGEEYPTDLPPGMQLVFLTPEKEKEQTQEDIDFEESLKMSLEEKE